MSNGKSGGNKGDAKAAFEAARTAHKRSQNREQSHETKTPAETKARTGTSFAHSHSDQLPSSAPSYEAKAPDHWSAFDKARRDKNDPVIKKWEKLHRANFERDRRIHASPVSKREQQALEKLRQKPQPTLSPHPTGDTAKRIEERIAVERERRIHHIKKRLSRIDGKAHSHFSRSR